MVRRGQEDGKKLAADSLPTRCRASLALRKALETSRMSTFSGRDLLKIQLGINTHKTRVPGHPDTF